MNATARPSTPPFGRIAKLPSGHEMHYLEQGKGPAVVLVHGSGPGANGYSNFKRNIGPIAEAGYRVLVPDMIGFGWSSKPDIDYPLDLFVTATLSGTLAPTITVWRRRFFTPCASPVESRL